MHPLEQVFSMHKNSILYACVRISVCFTHAARRV
jgi:hypothetical protein